MSDAHSPSPLNQGHVFSGSREEFSKIPLLDLRPQFERLRDEIGALVLGVLDHGQFIKGPEMVELEEELAEFAQVGDAVTVGNGTDALQIALMGEGVGPGDAVFVSGFTYVASAGAILLTGASPVFVDIRPKSYNMDPDDLEARIERVRKEGKLKPKAIMPVDLFGLPANYERILAIAEKHGLSVIADAAQSFGGTIHGKRVGCLAPVTTTSFYPTKPLGGYGDGGAVFTTDPERAVVFRSLREHGFPAGDRSAAVRLGLNSRLDTIQAAILLAKLRAFSGEIERREEVARHYDARLEGVVELPLRPEGVTSAWSQYSIRLENRDAVRAALTEHRIGTAIYYIKPLHVHPAHAAYSEGPGSLPVCEAVSGKVLSLPMHPDLTPGEIDRVCDVLVGTLNG
mgnify:CR=1 FL=1